MSKSVIGPELEALADVLVNVLVRGLIADYGTITDDSADQSIRKGNHAPYKKTPGPFSGSPGRSDVLQEQQTNDADSNTAVSMWSLPEGKTGNQSLTC